MVVMTSPTSVEANQAISGSPVMLNCFSSVTPCN